MGARHEGGGVGHALHMGKGDSAEALVADTLLYICERLTLTLDIWESSVYEYNPERDCLVGQAIWSRNLEQRDIDWIGTENQINRHRGIERVFSAHEVIVVHAENEQAGTPESERMDFCSERVRHSVEQTPFPGSTSDQLARVTISVGIASLLRHARTADDLVAAADRALYVAKHHGKNRVEICS